MTQHKSLLAILAVLIVSLAAGCIEDSYTTSPSDQPRFSVDTLRIGTIFTDEPSPTSRFTVHNPHSEQLSISRIALSGRDAGCFRINVDGMSGETFADVDIRARDSIFVLIEATLPQSQHIKPQEYLANVDFTVNGVTNSVVLHAEGQNVHRIKGSTISADTHFDADIPYQIFDSLTVAEGATLTLAPGTRLCFHDKARLIVRGTLVAQGTPEAPVLMEGDRQGNVVADISFDIMSRQWQGVFFTASSTANSLSHTIIRNTVQGVAVNGDESADYSSSPQLSMLNCRLTNSGDLVLEAHHTAIEATGCEFSEASNGLVFLRGGTHSFASCTFANYYLFTALGGPAIQFDHIGPELDDQSGLPWLKASFDNSIIYGNGTELSHGELEGTGITFRRCLLKSNGEDDLNFIECIWNQDPLYYTVREDYIFDYRLRPDSPASEAADMSLIPPHGTRDCYGLERSA
ncbi:MAG: hypothetical protein K2F63_04345, partial [Muribaculaceae bacterium]|nr:hypothetical protein [Muribaculaceae bacterium]